MNYLAKVSGGGPSVQVLFYLLLSIYLYIYFFIFIYIYIYLLLSKPFTVVIQPLSTCLIKPNFCFDQLWPYTLPKYAVSLSVTYTVY